MIPTIKYYYKKICYVYNWASPKSLIFIYSLDKFTSITYILILDSKYDRSHVSSAVVSF